MMVENLYAKPGAAAIFKAAHDDGKIVMACAVVCVYYDGSTTNSEESMVVNRILPLACKREGLAILARDLARIAETARQQAHNIKAPTTICEQRLITDVRG